MLAVVICSLFNVAMLVGLLAGIAVGLWRARGAIGEALAFDPLDGVTPAATTRRLRSV